MNVVIWHADHRFAWGALVGDTYKRLFAGFRKHTAKFGFHVVHLTCKGHEGWGDETRYFDLDPKNVVLNREIAFCEYLKTAEGLSWFSEPDIFMYRMFPLTTADCTLLLRPDDGVKICPAWRLAMPTALPIFEELRNDVQADGRHDWHGDSAACIELWRRFDQPVKDGKLKYRGLTVELRCFTDYVKPGHYTKNYMGNNKEALLKDWASA